MSLVVAIENENEIIIGTDSLILIKKDGKKQRGKSLKKVIKINQHLAIAITGTTLEVTLQIFEQYVADLLNTTDVDIAFETLCQKIKSTTFRENNDEQYRVTVFGYTGNKPKIKSIAVQAGYITDTDETYTNLYFSGEHDPVTLAEALLAGKVIGSSFSEVAYIITDTIATCIRKYPKVLCVPINIFKIQKP